MYVSEWREKREDCFGDENRKVPKVFWLVDNNFEFVSPRHMLIYIYIYERRFFYI